MKLVIVAVTVPSAAAWTGVLWPRAEATLTPAPHGAALEGRPTSFRAGAADPFPRTGATAACACTSRDTASSTTNEVQALANIMIQKNEL